MIEIVGFLLISRTYRNNKKAKNAITVGFVYLFYRKPSL